MSKPREAPSLGARAQTHADDDDRVIVTYDRVAYVAKPSRENLVGSARRVRRKRADRVFASELLALACNGHSFSLASYEVDPYAAVPRWGRFLGLNACVLAFENEREEHYVLPTDVLGRLRALGLSPLIMYHAFGSRPGYDACHGLAAVRGRPSVVYHPRFRVVVGLGETVTDAGEAQEAIRTLYGHFPEADQRCSGVGAIFLGSRSYGYDFTNTDWDTFDFERAAVS